MPPEDDWARIVVKPLGGVDGTTCCPVCKAWLFDGEVAQCCMPLEASSGTPAFLPPEVHLDDRFLHVNDDGEEEHVKLSPLRELFFGESELAQHFRKIQRPINIAHSYGSMVTDKERNLRFARFLKGKPRFIIKGELYFRIKPSLNFGPNDLLKVNQPTYAQLYSLGGDAAAEFRIEQAKTRPKGKRDSRRRRGPRGRQTTAPTTRTARRCRCHRTRWRSNGGTNARGRS